MKSFDEKGQEINGKHKIALPVNFKRPIPLADEIRRLVRNEMFQRDLRQGGVETFEESEDFDVDDDFDPQSPWEQNHDFEVAVQKEVKRRLRGGKVGKREKVGAVVGGNASGDGLRDVEAAGHSEVPVVRDENKGGNTDVQGVRTVGDRGADTSKQHK